MDLKCNWGVTWVLCGAESSSTSAEHKATPKSSWLSLEDADQALSRALEYWGRGLSRCGLLSGSSEGSRPSEQPERWEKGISCWGDCWGVWRGVCGGGSNGGDDRGADRGDCRRLLWYYGDIGLRTQIFCFDLSIVSVSSGFWRFSSPQAVQYCFFLAFLKMVTEVDLLIRLVLLLLLFVVVAPVVYSIVLFFSWLSGSTLLVLGVPKVPRQDQWLGRWSFPGYYCWCCDRTCGWVLN